MLSKPIRHEIKEKIPYDLHKCKVAQLKDIAREYKLKVGGKKAELIRRILDYFGQDKCVIVIQRIFRGHLVRHLFRLLDNSNPSTCNNPSDFFSLDPLTDIPTKNLICYTDSSGFRYGFSLESIFESVKHQCKLKNPYNRECFPEKVVDRIIRAYFILRIVSPDITVKLETEDADQLFRRMLCQNYEAFSASQSNLYLTMLAKFAQIQQKPVRTRILELFIEIDHLGNYTNPDWFGLLTRGQYIQFYRILYDIWNFRSRMPDSVRRNICILGDPFNRVNMINIIYSIEDITIDHIKCVCLQLFEYMVFGGIDMEHRQIGAFHALSALTVVSRGAREALPWLYESLGY